MYLVASIRRSTGNSIEVYGSREDLASLMIRVIAAYLGASRRAVNRNLGIFRRVEFLHESVKGPDDPVSVRPEHFSRTAVKTFEHHVITAGGK